jgi:protein dithiol oxidoreductase (disulfide-forming)
MELPMKRILIPALLIFLTQPFASAQAQAPVAGKDYVEIPNGKPLDPADDNKVAVEEFFSYICPACNGFEPILTAWAAKLPPYAKIVHIPATFRSDFMPYAKAYYAAEALGMEDKTHSAVYQAVHTTHKLPAEGDKVDEDRIAAFYADYGVTKDEFLSAMNSFGVQVKIRRATEHMKQCRVSSTPTIVINGRYLVQGNSYSEMLKTASYLIEKEHGS